LFAGRCRKDIDRSSQSEWLHKSTHSLLLGRFDDHVQRMRPVYDSLTMNTDPEVIRARQVFQQHLRRLRISRRAPISPMVMIDDKESHQVRLPIARLQSFA
jgi:hypothetical protein